MDTREENLYFDILSREFEEYIPLQFRRLNWVNVIAVHFVLDSFSGRSGGEGGGDYYASVLGSWSKFF